MNMLLKTMPKMHSPFITPISRLIIKPIISYSIKHQFSTTDNNSQKKSYIMPQKPQQIHEYKPKQPLTFKNGRFLLYLNKQNLLTPYLLDLPYTIPLAYFGYLIYINPFYLTFPAALPLMIILQAIIMIRWFARKSHFKRQIQRIYLISTGMQIQIVYANKIRRVVKDNSMASYHFINDFYNKSVQLEQEGKIQPIRGMRFTNNIHAARQSVRQPVFMQYGWTLRDKDFKNYILPAKYHYADWNLLTKVLNGVNINVSETAQQSTFTKDEIPEIQQEFENIKKLNEKTKINSQTQAETQAQTNNKKI